MTPSPFERLHELLADRAVSPLTETESTELLRLLNDFPDEPDDAYDLAAAAFAVGGVSPDTPLPGRLREKIGASANDYFGERPARAEVVAFKPAAERPAPSPKPRVQWAGWLAAAASLVIAALAWMPRANPATPGPLPANPSAEYRKLLSEVKDTVKATWTLTGDPGAKDVKGDVVWSNSQQKGFMRFEGLPVNAHDLAVYQLWIFDTAQDERYPIDGGVFDVTQNGDVVVPIKAKIDVKQPTMFAITVEKPGGVVVSKRERLLLVAKIGTDGRTAGFIRPPGSRTEETPLLLATRFRQ